MSDSAEQIIQERQKRLIEFLKQRADYVVYLLLGLIVYAAVWIRTRNVPLLKDVSTNDWTLGPDLDPFLFLRWSQYIIEHGKLFAIDMMRYIPNGFDTTGEYLLHPYIMAWFHNIFSGIFSWTSTQSAIYYPVFMTALTVIAFFLFVRTAFEKFVPVEKANAIALVSSFFLSILPPFIPRSIAGIPEKESVAFLFMFLAFYFFISSWKCEKKLKSWIFAILAGASTAGMSFIWGGNVFIFYILSVSVGISFLLGNVKRNQIAVFAFWTLSSFLLMVGLFNQFNIRTIISSSSSGAAIILLGVMIFHEFFSAKMIRRFSIARKISSKLSSRVFSFLAILIIGLVLISLLFGPSLVSDTLSDLYFKLIKPAQTRLITTVAENRQPFFNEWASQFGPNVKSIYLTFWIFFIGSVVLVNKIFSNVFENKRRYIIVGAYLIFLFAVVFTRYSSSSVFNGENFLSQMVYAIGACLFAGIFVKMSYELRSESKSYLLKNISLGALIVITFFFLGIVGARGLIRLVLLLVPPGAIMIGYISVTAFYSAKDSIYEKKDYYALFLAGLIVLASVYSGYVLFKVSENSARSYVPSVYTQQWQKAMSWTRENTSPNAVFGHWWDYGYWLQSIGERATVLDGGNTVPYWNHLMGRHALTGPTEKEAIEFLYAHNVTHFLIDSTDIGKYGAFSKIGSDENYDRQSWIPVLQKDNSQSANKKNTTLHIYPGGTTVEDDIQYNFDGENVFLPAGKTALGAIIVEESNDTVKTVRGVYVYQGKQYIIPIRYYYDIKYVDTGEGIDAGVFFFQRVVSQGNEGYIENRGALLFLSPRVVHSELARIYLFNEKSSVFKLIHSEQDGVIENLRSQGVLVNDFVLFQDFRGPIKIWELDYPSDIAYKKEYLETQYPESLKRA